MIISISLLFTAAGDLVVYGIFLVSVFGNPTKI